MNKINDFLVMIKNYVINLQYKFKRVLMLFPKKINLIFIAYLIEF